MSAVSSPVAQLTERRRALGLTQARLAELIRVGRVTLAKWECGDERMTPRRQKQVDTTLTTLEAGYRVAAEVAREAGQP